MNITKRQESDRAIGLSTFRKRQGTGCFGDILKKEIFSWKKTFSRQKKEEKESHTLVC